MNSSENTLSQKKDLFFHLGLQHQKNEEYEHMKKNWEIAIDLGSEKAMLSLGIHYKKIENNIDLMKKYLMLAVDLGNSDAMVFLGLYYQEIKRDSLMKKYCKMAIDLGNSDAMNELANFYKSIDNYELAEHYYLKAVKLENVNSMHDIGVFYGTHRKYEKAKKYYNMAANHGSEHGIYNLMFHYKYTEKNFEKAFRMCLKYTTVIDRHELICSLTKMFGYHNNCDQISTETLQLFAAMKITEKDNVPLIIRLYHKLLNEKINIIRLHFKYAPTAKGAEEAKMDFFSKISLIK